MLKCWRPTLWAVESWNCRTVDNLMKMRAVKSLFIPKFRCSHFQLKYIPNNRQFRCTVNHDSTIPRSTKCVTQQFHSTQSVPSTVPHIRPVRLMMPASKSFEAALHQPVFFADPSPFQVLKSGCSLFCHFNTTNKDQRLKPFLPIFG